VHGAQAGGHRPAGLRRPRRDRAQRHRHARRARGERRRGGEVLMLRRIALAAGIGTLTLTLAACATGGAPSSAHPGQPPARRATLMFFADAHGQLEAHPELFWADDGTTTTAPAGGYA